MEHKPVVTVIIPAKNRAPYLHHTLRTCMMQTYERLEVIVSDDGSTDGTREMVEAAQARDPRIRYVSPGGSVGMRENFEFALRQIQPGYVMALGADDGLLPHGIEGMLEVLADTRQELLAWSAPVFAYPNTRLAQSQLTLARQGRTRVIQSADFLKRQAEHLHYLSDVESPMFYVKGLTSTALVDRVRSRTRDGCFYSCPTPDGYSGIVLAGEVKTYAMSGRPFSIFGASPSSQGLAYINSGETAKNLSESFFRTVADSPMHPQLASQPYSPLITLMTVDYLLTTSDLPGWQGPRPTIDFRRVLLKSIGELQHGLYSADRTARELSILDRIASHHGLGDFFRSTVRSARRHAIKKPLEGDAFSPSMVVLDAAACGIENIVDAAYFARFAHEVAARPLLPEAMRALVRSARYRLASLRKGDPFPPESSWRQETT
jgi:hypothetical protein